MKKAIYMKCRPGSPAVDLKPLILKHKRVFIGYPAWRVGWHWDPCSVGGALFNIDPRHGDFDANLLDPECGARGYKSRITRNRNLAESIDEGSIVVIPRLNEGVCYIGRISGRFDFIENPSAWAADFEFLRKQAGLANAPLQLAEVVQSWPVEDGFRAIRYPLIPKWLSLLKRDAIGEIPDRPDGRKAAIDVLDALYEGRYEYDFTPTDDIAIVERRLMEWVGDRQFEHLVVDLLQCEYQHQRWWHTGGPGDGGADAIATDNSGTIVGILQCKWFYSGTVMDLANGFQSIGGPAATAHAYVATLYDTGQVAPNDPRVTHISRTFLAELLLKHRPKIPFARTIGIV